jgi:hypothetical protein
LFSRAVFPITLGSSYFLQFGAHFPNQPYSGTFQIGSPYAPPLNDECNTPFTVSGAGPHPFDLTYATTGSQGQQEAICYYAGSYGMVKDVWFTWQAATSGPHKLSMCGSFNADSKVAVYEGAGCPTTPAIACVDDACLGVNASVCFHAVAGQLYTFQIGLYPSATTQNTGSFKVWPNPALSSTCGFDSGVSDDAWGLTLGGEVVWFQRFGDVGESTLVGSISGAFGTAQYQGFAPPPGTAVKAFIWDDPNDDGDPTDAILMGQTTGVMTQVSNDMFDTFRLCPPVRADGVYFVGLSMIQSVGQYAASYDSASCPIGAPSRAWIAGSTTYSLDAANLMNNDVLPQHVGAGLWLMRAECGTPPNGVPVCLGDGTGAACPCGNVGAVGHGCASSVVSSGALLTAYCQSMLTADTLLLHGSGMPVVGTCLYLQGTTALNGGNGAAFGDGLRCAGGSVIRLATKTNVNGASQYPAAGDQPISIRGLIPPGTTSTRVYQCWYRNAALFCVASAAFNLSNGVTIQWAP